MTALSATRVALVTGGNRGVGFEVCKQLAGAGLRVALGSRDQGRGERAAAALRTRYGLTATPVQLDLSDPASISRALTTVAQELGPVDVLINNAAINPDRRRTLADISIEELRGVFDVNVFGVVQLCQALLPGMLERGYGRVVNVTSGRGSFTRLAADGAAYRLSKATLNALTVVLADQVRGSGVLVNACTPGRVKTRLTGFRGTHSIEEGAAEIIRLATLAEGGPTGGFFKDGQPLPW